MSNPPLDQKAEVVDQNRRWTADWYGWLVELTTPVDYTAAKLPSVDITKPPAARFDRAFVTDASSTTFGSVVAGGGANVVPVYFDGTSWRIG